MFNSIQQFETAGIKNLRKAEDEFIRTRDMANFINAIKEVVFHLGLDVIAETLENYDEAIRKSPKRSEKWSVVRKDPKQLVTSLGTVQYRKDNCVLTKMVYVYEGIEPEASGSKRHGLINPHYFCGVYDGTDNDKLWQEVYDYLDETYDLTKVKKVYLNADGGSWIQGAKNRLHGLTRVMDEFHLNKYLLRMTGGLLDSAGDARRELVHQIKKGTQEGFGYETEHILSVTESASAQERIAESANYILHN